MNDIFGWRNGFLIQVPLIIFATILITIFLPWGLHLTPGSAPQTMAQNLRRIDYLGSLTFVLFIGLLLTSVTLNSTEGLPWSHPTVYGSFIASIFSGVAFIVTEARWSAEPVMPLQLLGQRTSAAVVLSNL